MAADFVSVGCRLPHGLILRAVGADKKERRVTLNGANKSLLIGGCGITKVPRDFWNEWHRNHKDAAFLVSGAVFVTNSESDAAQEGKSREGEKTGFEGADPRKVDKQLAELSRS